MPYAYPPLTDRQVEVLSWIASNCPEGVMQGYSYKTTAIALQNRRLVSVSKKGGVWRAVATEAGSYYLEHGSYLELAPNSRRPPIAAARSGQASQQRTDGPGKRPQLVRRTKSLSPTEKLIADLVAHGQVSGSGPYRAKYEARVAAALRFGKVPEGKVMVTEGTRWSREYVIRLQDAPEWLTTALAPVPVPTTLRGAHPAVKALDVEKLLVGLDRSVKHRALLLIQALAAEAQRRGYDVQATKVTTDAYGYQRRETKDQLTISAGQHSVGIRLYQLNNRTRHEPTPAEEAKAASDRWYRIPKFDVSPSERLSIELSGRFEHRQSKWTDGSSGRLEGSLAQILQEIELRSEAAAAERLKALADAEQRRHAWEGAMMQAKADYAEAYRAGILSRQVDGWLRASQVRDYLDAMQARLGEAVDESSNSAVRWFRWAQKWVDSADPLSNPLEMPAVPEPTPEELQPHLHGWSPYGPDRMRW